MLEDRYSGSWMPSRMGCCHQSYLVARVRGTNIPYVVRMEHFMCVKAIEIVRVHARVQLIRRSS